MEVDCLTYLESHVTANRGRERKVVHRMNDGCEARRGAKVCGVRYGSHFSLTWFSLLEQKPVLYYEWPGMVETHALYR